MPVSPVRRVTLIAAAAIAALAASASPVMASAAGGCPPAATSNPFAAWEDGADYELAPAGDVEDGGASWSLTGGAAAVEGNETFVVSGLGDHLSIRMPGSASATTAPMCISAAHPSFRFFAKRHGGSKSGRLLAEVVYRDAGGDEVAVTAGAISASNTWAPSPSLPTAVDELLSGGDDTIDVSFRFTPHGGGIWSVDDVYVDPLRGR